MKDLPRFRSRPLDWVQSYIAQILTNERAAPTTRLVSLLTYEDKHYRAIFRPDYFQLQEGQQEPTKSQWNTLKKRMKRIESDIFVFKDHGEVPCGPTGGRCYYLDFGYLAHEKEPKPRYGEVRKTSQYDEQERRSESGSASAPQQPMERPASPVEAPKPRYGTVRKTSTYDEQERRHEEENDQ